MLWVKFENWINRISRWCNWLACFAVLLMMIMVCANVFLNFLFKQPILGTFEYVKLLSALLIGFGLANTQLIKGHVAVDVLMQNFSKRIQAVVDSITGTVALVAFGLVIWKLAGYAYHNFKLNLTTDTMYIPLSPFMFILALGFMLFWIVLLVDVISSIYIIKEGDKR